MTDNTTMMLHNSQLDSELRGSTVAIRLLRNVLLLGVAAIIGCGGGADRPPRFAVTGTVKLNGEPVSDAFIVFTPTKSESTQVARGKTDSSGYYELTTWDTGDGAIPGAYKVTISKSDPSLAISSQEVDLNDPGADYDAMMTGGDETVETESLLPAVYANLDTTPEERTVAESPNEFNFDLKSD